MINAPHLILIGLMGSGKSSVGKICAQQLGRSFIDTDDVIATNNNAPITELFSILGESVFRDQEQAVVAQVCSSESSLVIACGGGAVLDRRSRDIVKSSGTVVWLQASPDELQRRIKDPTTRPLLAGGQPSKILTDLADIRNPIYQSTADFCIDTQSLTATEVAAAVIKEYAPCPA